MEQTFKPDKLILLSSNLWSENLAFKNEKEHTYIQTKKCLTQFLYSAS